MFLGVVGVVVGLVVVGVVEVVLVVAGRVTEPLETWLDGKGEEESQMITPIMARVQAAREKTVTMSTLVNLSVTIVKSFTLPMFLT